MNQQDAILMIFKSEEYDALLACASSNKEHDKMEAHIDKLNSARDQLIQLAGGLKSIDPKDYEAGMRASLDVLKKMLEVQQLMTDRKYMEFLFLRCESEYVKNEEQKMKLVAKTIAKMLAGVQALAKKRGVMDDPLPPTMLSPMKPMIEILEGSEYSELLQCAKRGGSWVEKHAAKIEGISEQILAELHTTTTPPTISSFLKLGKMIIALQESLSNPKYLRYLLSNCSKQFIDNEIAKVRISQKSLEKVIASLKKHS